MARLVRKGQVINVAVSTYKLFTSNNLDRPYLDGNLEPILETIIYSYNLASKITEH